MILYTAWWPERFKRVIGRLDKRGKLLEDVFVVVPFPTEDGMMEILQHVDSVAFAIDKNNQRIVYDIKTKKLENLRPLDDFHPANISHIKSQYIQATTSLYIPDEMFDDDKKIII